MKKVMQLAILAFAVVTSGARAFAQTPTSGAVSDVTGKWTFTVETENGTGTPAVVLKQEGEKLTGTYESARSGLRELEGTVKGKAITFVVKGNVDLKFSGTIEGPDAMKGSADFSGMGSASWIARRQK